MSVSTTHATVRPGTQGKLSVAVVSALVFAAAIVGLLLGGSFGGRPPTPRPGPAPQTIAHEGLSLQVPSGWVRGDAVTILGFSRPLGLRSKDDSMRATVELLPATSANLLPAAFLQTLRGVSPRPDVVRLASGRHSWRYRLSEDDGSVTLLYAAPTTSGVATVACLSPLDGSVPHGCEEIAQSITVPGSRPLEPGASAAFFSRLPAAVNDLDASRTKGVRELSAAPRSTGQAAAADELSRAHKAAGAALAPLTAEGDRLTTSTVRALNTTAAAYAALANAARSRLPRPYADAGRAVTNADADLRRTLQELAAAASPASPATPRPESSPVRTPAARATPAAAKRPVKVDTRAATKEAPAGRATPAATKRPVNADARVTVKDAPAPSTSQGLDLTLPLLALLGLIAIVLAIRQTLRAPPHRVTLPRSDT